MRNRDRPLLLIGVATFGAAKRYRLTNADERDFLRWALVANARGHYSRGSSETILDQDLAVTMRGGSLQDLFTLLRQQFFCSGRRRVVNSGWRANPPPVSRSNKKPLDLRTIPTVKVSSDGSAVEADRFENSHSRRRNGKARWRHARRILHCSPTAWMS